MSKDAKNSLIAATAVISLGLFGYIVLQVTKGLSFPRWVPLFCFAFAAANVIWRAFRHFQKRRISSPTV